MQLNGLSQTAPAAGTSHRVSPLRELTSAFVEKWHIEVRQSTWLCTAHHLSCKKTRRPILAGVAGAREGASKQPSDRSGMAPQKVRFQRGFRKPYASKWRCTAAYAQAARRPI